MNAEFATAEEDLRAALAAADVLGSGHYRALALRHLVQGLAWHRPEEAARTGAEALDLNTRMNESAYAVAACHATLAVAGTRLRPASYVDEQIEASFEALRAQNDERNHQYLCVAEVFHASVHGDHDRARRARAYEVAIGTSRGIYQHWEAVTGAWLRELLGSEPTAAHPPVTWLAGEDIVLARSVSALRERRAPS